MKIEKKNIISTLGLFANVYTEFSKTEKNKEEMESMINAWVSVFEAIDFDYDEANEDFLKASKTTITKSKYVPTIAEISEEMKKLYMQRQEKIRERKMMDMLEIEHKCNLINSNREKAMMIYSELSKKYSNSQIVLEVKKYREEENIGKIVILRTEDVFERLWRGNE